jgi:hypothetical protein
MTVDDLTNEMLATAIKHLSAKRQNLYRSTLGEFELGRDQRDHLNSEIDALNDVIHVLETEREKRRTGAS